MYIYNLLWALRTTKAIVFYLYLWQLKEYHLGRFLDHFRTAKGKSLFFNKINYLKFALLLFFPFLPLFPFFVLFFVYLLEAFRVLADLFLGRIKKPVLTKKAVFLIFVSLGVELIFLSILQGIKTIAFFVFGLLVFDVLVPVVVSAIVLLFQPLAVLGRNRIVRKAKFKRAQFPNLLTIGITGSYGKTSTKELLYAILVEKFGPTKILKTKDHQNSEVGISCCILNDLNSGHEIFICEMGAYNRGGIRLLCGIAQPKIGVLTGINEQHMATFGSQENIIKTKYELIESLPQDGVAFFNARNKYCVELHNKTQGVKKILYGQEASFSGGENVLGATAVAKELGMANEEMQKVIEKIGNQMPGIKLKDGVNGLKILDATYSANPDGVLANLEYLKSFSGKKIIVMPCLIELGKASKEVHRRIGAKIAKVCDLAVITTKDRFGETKVEAGEKVVFLENPKEIFEKIKSTASSGDVVLLESRVPKELINLLNA